jgi:hypothetical protein
MAYGPSAECTVGYGQGTKWSGFGAWRAQALDSYSCVQQDVMPMNRLGMWVVLHVQRRGSRER